MAGEVYAVAVDGGADQAGARGRLKAGEYIAAKSRRPVTRGAGSRAAALAMVFTLVESARARWRV
ncbi:hypothetical protein ACH4ND_30215 [Streptomyces sp. NPDC017179]|uniref:hypothetical protein n=1 Tax=Streptomyces sp. NPDC017179 TaxID=3364979 RepID=UPI0037890F55